MKVILQGKGGTGINVETDEIVSVKEGTMTYKPKIQKYNKTKKVMEFVDGPECALELDSASVDFLKRNKVAGKK